MLSYGIKIVSLSNPMYSAPNKSRVDLCANCWYWDSSDKKINCLCKTIS